MKLLAIVSDILKNHFLHSFSCDTDFLSSWDEVAHTQLKSYDLIVAMGSLIEDKSHALALWRVASEIRYFKVPAIFVDVSMQASKVLSTHYPNIKQLSFNNDIAQFTLQLRTCQPQLFFDNAEYYNSTLSASANAHRYADKAQTLNAHRSDDNAHASMPSISNLSGERSLSSSEIRIANAHAGSFDAVSSLPLGENSEQRYSDSTAQKATSNFKNSGLGKGRPEIHTNASQNDAPPLDPADPDGISDFLSAMFDDLNRNKSDSLFSKELDNALSALADVPSVPNQRIDILPPETPSARQSDPAVPSEIPSARQSNPAVPSEIPNARQSNPAMRAEIPYIQQPNETTQSGFPHTRQPSPAMPSEIPYAQQSNPAMRSEIPYARQSNPAMRSEVPYAQQSNPAMRSEVPYAQQSNPAMRSEIPYARQSNPAMRSEIPYARQSNPAMRSEIPSARQSNPAMRSEIPYARQSNPAMRSEIPSARQSNPAMRSEIPSARQSNPAMRSEAPYSHQSGLTPKSIGLLCFDSSEVSDTPDVPVPTLPPIVRTQNDILQGNIHFGKLINIIQTAVRLQLTGVLEIKNDTRSARIEFKQGAPFITCTPAIIASALGWTSGDYSFDSSKMLSQNAQPIDINLLFAAAAHEQLPLNPLLKALELEFNSYVVLTNMFDEKKHMQMRDRWWDKCDGNTKFSALMMTSGLPMDTVSRDIFLAWLCDEICFLKTPCEEKIRIEYQIAPPPVMPRRHSSAISELPDTANAQILALRKQLTDLRKSFSSKTGYEILGLRRGCGIKALDTAYYAWINRYHADRFVRYNDAVCIKLANDLLMLMNTTYAKLAQSERGNNSAKPGASRIVTRQSDLGSTRLNTSKISANQQRISSMSMSSIPNSSEKFRSVSSDLRSLETSTTRADGQSVLKMSDLLAKRNRSSQIMDKTTVGLPPAGARQANTDQPNAEAQRCFENARKNLKNGLYINALDDINIALSISPDNKIYIICQHYIQAHVDPISRPESIKKIKEYADLLSAAYKLDENFKMQLFCALYCLGKLQLASERYAEASETLNRALKLNENDIDILRSLHYISQQLDKSPQSPSVTNFSPVQSPDDPNKGFFGRLKDKFSF